MSLRFDNRVVIVTGAGAGLGRTYALLFGSRGAKVVVNDLGTSHVGEGKSSKAADLVVEEIRKAGGEAMPNYDSVEQGDKIVKAALDKWGRIDIVVNNAGILRDVSFMKMKDSEWDIIYRVHLLGAYAVTRAAWNHMREAGFGRIIMTTSAAGLYGNFGQANYSAMKLALVGFASTLAKEGEKRNVFVNTIAPLAGTRLTETVMPPDLVAALKPEYIAPLVAYLCHDSSTVNGQIFEVGAGWVSNVRWQRSKGHFFNVANGAFTPEAVGPALEKITDFSEPSYPTSPNDSFGPVNANLEKIKAGGAVASSAASAPKNDAVDVATALAAKFPPAHYAYTNRDAALYALSVGVSQNGPACASQLSYVYENSPEFRVLPTMGVIFPFSLMMQITNMPGLKFNPMMLLHGEQYLELRGPIPTSGTLTSTARVAGVYDKGKGALVVLETVTRDEQGKEVAFNQFSSFIRGIGGFGGERGPAPENADPPARAPDAVSTDKTNKNQALIYRWTSGDLNPLHADPSMAAMGGFDQPILHGLCTFGFAGKAVLQHFCKWDSAKFKSIRARFNRHVFPGETLVTEMWRVAPNKVLFRVKVEERNEYAIVGGVVELAGAVDAAPAKAAAAPAAGGNFKSAALFAELDKRVAAGGADLVKKVAGVYQFDVSAGGKTRSWTIDLKTGPVGKVTEGAAAKPDVTLTLADDDCAAMFTGKLNSQQAFMQGKLKMKGDMKFAMKLGQVISSQGAKL